MVKDTGKIMEEINRMTDPERFKKYVAENASAMKHPKAIDFLIACAEKHGVSKTEMTKETVYSVSYANRLFAGTKPMSRDHLLQFAFLGSLTLEETQNVLKYASQPQLYPKDVRDGVIIFALNNHKMLVDVDRTLAEMHLKTIVKPIKED